MKPVPLWLLGLLAFALALCIWADVEMAQARRDNIGVQVSVECTIYTAAHTQPCYALPDDGRDDGVLKKGDVPDPPIVRRA